jgi:hypothetical protein
MCIMLQTPPDKVVSLPLQILLLQRGLHHRVRGEHRVFQFSLCALCDLCGSKSATIAYVWYFHLMDMPNTKAI